MLVLLAMCTAGTVDAQSWKKKNDRHKHRNKKDKNKAVAGDDKYLSKKQEKKIRKEQKHKEKQERKKQKRERKKQKHESYEERESADVPAGRPGDAYPYTKMKARYRVDILAALYLDELVKGESVTYKNKIPEKAAQGLAFYEGILIAADSLKKAGFKIDIYVHDISSAAETPQMLVAEDKLDSTDLIIGAIQSRDVPMLAAYARKKQINFVSTVSQPGNLRGNVYFTAMEPSLQSHCDWIAGNVINTFQGMNIALLYRTSEPGDEVAYRHMTVDNAYHRFYRELSCDVLPTKEKLAKIFDTTIPNIVIIPILSAGYADTLLTKLSRDFPFTHFEVYGMPTWSAMKNLLKKNAFPNLSINITIPFHVDPYSAPAKYVSRIYKKDYGNRAPESVYRGYETMFWYANLLKRYGTIFNVRYEDNTTAPFTSFEMKPLLDRNGEIMFYENKHVFLSKYEGGVNKTE